MPAASSFGGIPQPPADMPRILIYADPNYGGHRTTLTLDQPDLHRRHIDRVSSLRVVYGVWEICDQPHYEGRCHTVSADEPNLALGPVASIRKAR